MNTAVELVSIFSTQTSMDIANAIQLGVNNLIARTEGNKTGACDIPEFEGHFVGSFNESGHSISYLCYYVSNHPYLKPHYLFEFHLGFFV